MAGAYILRCADGTLYVGSTTDRERRLKEHNAGRGGRYTRSRRPVRMAYWEGGLSRLEARRREASLKKLGRGARLALIEGYEES